MKIFVFNIEAGHTLLRQYQKYNNQHDLVNDDPLFSRFDDGFFIKAQLAYRLRMDTE